MITVVWLELETHPMTGQLNSNIKYRDNILWRV